MKITPRYITINKNVFIEKNCRIEAVTSYNDTCFHPSIVFEENVSVQQNLHLTCASQITIGRNTAIASNVSITDIHHPYDDINTPIEQQDIITKPVTIGSDSKIYNNTVILPGVHIGKHCTIGANSVVTHDIPDYSVAVGAPARVVKQYNFETKQWEKK
jgi:acetyltransferase-like isoleucine patch superfamily enzyme